MRICGSLLRRSINFARSGSKLICPKCKSEIPDNSQSCQVCAELARIENNDKRRKIRIYSAVNPILAIITIYLGTLRIDDFLFLLRKPNGYTFPGIFELIAYAIYNIAIPIGFIFFSAILLFKKNIRLCIALPIVQIAYVLWQMIDCMRAIILSFRCDEHVYISLCTEYIAIHIMEIIIFSAMIILLRKIASTRAYMILCFSAIIVGLIVKLFSADLSGGVSFGMTDSWITISIYHFIPEIMLYRYFKLKELKSDTTKTHE